MKKNTAPQNGDTKATPPAPAALDGQHYRVRAFQFRVQIDLFDETGRVKNTGQLDEVTVLEAALTPAMRQVIADCGLSRGLEPPS